MLVFVAERRQTIQLATFAVSQLNYARDHYACMQSRYFNASRVKENKLLLYIVIAYRRNM